jgi:Uma2 family endonuclease
MATLHQIPPAPPGPWPEQGDWTYEDYARLPNDGWRYEVIRGVLYMAPAPNTKHQYAGSVLVYHLTDFVAKHQLGRVYFSPIDVILPDIASPVQPDILFIHRDRLGIIKEQTIDGPPDLVVEILSPATLIYDRRTKYETYQAAGVKEYWIIDVRQATIDVFGLQDGLYIARGQYQSGDTAASYLLEGFTIGVDAVCGG